MNNEKRELHRSCEPARAPSAPPFLGMSSPSDGGFPMDAPPSGGDVELVEKSRRHRARLEAAMAARGHPRTAAASGDAGWDAPRGDARLGGPSAAALAASLARQRGATAFLLVALLLALGVLLPTLLQEEQVAEFGREASTRAASRFEDDEKARVLADHLKRGLEAFYGYKDAANADEMLRQAAEAGDHARGAEWDAAARGTEGTEATEAEATTNRAQPGNITAAPRRALLRTLR